MTQISYIGDKLWLIPTLRPSMHSGTSENSVKTNFGEFPFHALR
jgi:hypothetical protein